MYLRRELCGFDRKTERLVDFKIYPEGKVADVRSILGPRVGTDDPDLILVYEVTSDLRGAVENLLCVTLDPVLDYFFDTSAVSDGDDGEP